MSRRCFGWACIAGAGLSGIAAALVAAVAPVVGPLLSALLAQGIWLGAALGAALLVSRDPLSRTLGLGATRYGPWTVLLVVLCFCAFSEALSQAIEIVEALSSRELRQEGSLGAIDALLRESRGGLFALAFLALGLAPGIGEEVLFRGFLQRRLAVALPPWLAVALAAALFAAAHLDPVHSLAAVGLGLYLGAAALLLGSTRVAISAHVANNSLAVLSSDGTGSLAGALLVPWFVGVVLLVCWSRHSKVAKKPH